MDKDFRGGGGTGLRLNPLPSTMEQNMNKQTIAIIAILAVAALAIACVPATDTDAVDGTDFSTVLGTPGEDGKYTVNAGTYYLNDDLTVNGPLSFNGAITLNLNGHTLTIAKNKIATVELESNLTIAGEGRIEGDSNPLFNVKGTMTLETATIHNAQTSAVKVPSTSVTVGDDKTSVKGTFNMNGGALTSDKSYALYVSGGAANIKAGTVGPSSSNALYITKSSTVTIGETGTAGPTITTMSPNSANVTINSGTIGAVKSNFGDDSTFNCVFESDVSQYLPQKYTCAQSGDGFTVVELTEATAAAKLDDTPYGSLVKAASVMTDGQTLTLMKDYVGDKSVSVAIYYGTIDLNGFSITNNGGKSTSYGLEIYPEHSDKPTQTEYGAVEIVNNGTATSTITSTVPIHMDRGNDAYPLELSIKGSIRTVATGDSGSILMTDGRLVYTQEAASMIATGGFLATTADGDQYIFGSLAEALKEDKNKTAVLLNDYDGRIGFNLGAGYTLDLNEHTVRSNENAAIDINDSNCELTIRNGTIEAKYDGIAVAVAGEGFDGPITYENSGVVLIDVNLKANGGYGIVTNGSCSNMDITVTGGSIEVPSGHGIYHPSTGDVVLKDVAISALTGVEHRKGSLEISGKTTIAATGEYHVESNNSGTTTSGAAVAIVSYETEIKVDISGGTFTGAVAFSQQNPSGVENVNYDFSISGGDFTSTGTDKNGQTYPAIVTEIDEATGASEVTEPFVTGGTFSGDVSDYMPKGIQTGTDESGQTVVTPPIVIEETEVTVLTTTYQIFASHYDGATVKYTSSDETNFDVDPSGKVTITGAGTATITATVTVEGKEYTDTITLTYSADHTVSTPSGSEVQFNAVVIQPDDELTGRYNEVKDLPEGLEMNAEGWTFIDVERTDGSSDSATFRLTVPGLTAEKRFVIVHFGDTVDYPTYKVGNGYVDVTATSFSPFAYITYDEYTITFEGEGVETQTMTVPAGSSLDYSDFQEPSRDGYQFMYWADENGDRVTHLDNISSDHTLTAVWIKQIDISVDRSGTLYEGGSITVTVSTTYVPEDGESIWYRYSGAMSVVSTNEFTISQEGTYTFAVYVLKGDVADDVVVGAGIKELVIKYGVAPVDPDDPDTPVDPDDPSTDPDTPVEPAPGWDDDEPLPPMPPASTSDSDDGSVTIVACAAAAAVAALMAVFLIVTYRKD